MELHSLAEKQERAERSLCPIEIHILGSCTNMDRLDFLAGKNNYIAGTHTQTLWNMWTQLTGNYNHIHFERTSSKRHKMSSYGLVLGDDGTEVKVLCQMECS